MIHKPHQASESQKRIRPPLGEGARIAKIRTVASTSAPWQVPATQQEGMYNMILPVTLTFCGVAALMNFWLAIRVGQARTREKVPLGDGGNDFVIARMRAHANYVEYTPFVLLLIGALELSHTGAASPNWLWIVASVYFLGRIAHGLGMDRGAFTKGRAIGTITTMLTLVALGIYAIAVPHMTQNSVQPASAIDMPTAEEVPAG